MDFLTPPSASSEDSVGPSTSQTTPEWSPYLAPQRSAALSSAPSSNGLGPAALPDHFISNVCVVGAGYVGGPTAAVLALHNPDVRVTVLDRDAARVAAWQSRHLPIHEPGLEQVVRIARDGGCPATDRGQARRGNLFFSTDSRAAMDKADVIFLAVNTPTKASGRGAGSASDLSALEGAVRDIATYAKDGAIIVEKSTVPSGTSNLISDILSSLRRGETFPILSNPEFLAEGSAVKNLLYPDRVLIGSTRSVAGRFAAARLAALYSSWVPEDRIMQTNVWSSELAKLVANAMLAQRISSINSISALCERTGADVREIAKAVGTDDRIGSRFLQSGLGFGGSCFRKDISSLVYIAESLHLPEVADYWRSVLLINGYQRRRFHEKIIAKLNNTLVGKKVVILGFAYKKNTGDTRESLAVDVVASLLPERPAEIAIFDPCCPKAGIEREMAHLEGFGERVKIYSNPYAACADASAIAIMTEWDLFKAEAPAFANPKPAAAPQPGHAEGPLRAYAPPEVKPCADGCEQCASTDEKFAVDVDERLDWARVAEGMKHPRYVLDGRGILEERAFKVLGLDLEGLGWGAMSSAQYAW